MPPPNLADEALALSRPGDYLELEHTRMKVGAVAFAIVAAIMIGGTIAIAVVASKGTPAVTPPPPTVRAGGRRAARSAPPSSNVSACAAIAEARAFADALRSPVPPEPEPEDAAFPSY